MRQTSLLDNKYFSSSKGEKHKTTDSKSIDVDRVKVYQINDVKHNVRSIDLEPVQLVKQNVRFGRAENRQLSHKRGSESSQKIKVEEKRERGKIIERQDKENNSGNHQTKHKKSPLQSFISKIHKIISHFLSINETNPAYGITSQQFYNLFQSRKVLSHHTPNLTSVPKFLFQASYTNYLSFLSFVIETKQKKYEIYDSLQSLEKILQLIQTQICDIQDIYLAQEQAKIDQIYSEELILQIQKVEDKLALIYPKNKKPFSPVEQDLTGENYPSNDLPNNPGQAQEGQINLQSFSNCSFSKGSKEFLDAQIGPINSMYLIQRDEHHAVIEEESRQQTQVFYGQSSEKLISCKEERQIYEINQVLIESDSNQQQYNKSSNMMELEE